MKANNLSISVPYKGCDKQCPYCVSKMTPPTRADHELFLLNMGKVLRMAGTARINSVSITGKGEPTRDLKMVGHILDRFCTFPVELQTNGLFLQEHPEEVDALAKKGLDVFAISIDNLEDFDNFSELFKRINVNNKIVRVTLNITDMLPDPAEFGFKEYLKLCHTHHIHQLSFRKIVRANFTEENAVHRWIDRHANNTYYEDLIAQADLGSQRVLRMLSYGATLYDIEGISFTHFTYCIQDMADDQTIRSLIYKGDGHLYTAWNSPASIIF